MGDAYRQEVFNVVLAQLLQESGVITAPETIFRRGLDLSRRMPDLIVNYSGLRLAIEGEVSDQLQPESRAIRAARRRVEEGIAHIGVAIVYPHGLRRVDLADLKSELGACELRIALVTESEDTGFSTGNIDYLESALRHAFEQLVQEDVVLRAVAALDAGIERFAAVVGFKRGTLGRIASALGVRPSPQKEPPSGEP